MPLEKGFVLFTLLLFLQLFSSVGLFALLNISMIMKINQHGWDRKINQMKTDYILSLIETNFSTQTVSCLIPVMPVQQLAKEPLSWWQQYSCSGNLDGIRYYYAVEALGKDECAMVRKID